MSTFGWCERAQVVRRALAALSEKQRTVLVLRYFADLSEAQIAEVMGCSAGAFDPRRRVGVLNYRGPKRQVRYIGDRMLWPEKSGWDSYPRLSMLSPDLPITTAMFWAAFEDPALMLRRLRAEAELRPGGAVTGQGWKGRRHLFPIADAKGAKWPYGGTGFVDIDDQGRARRLSLTLGLVSKPEKPVDRLEVEYSDYGSAVTVPVPPPAK